MSEEKTGFWSAPRYRLYRIAVYFLVLVLLSEVAARIYFAQPNLVERNTGNTTDAMDYLFEQMAKHKGRKIVFLGSSVVQGYGNCTDGTHFPKIVERMLHEQYGWDDIACYNLSSAGNRFGDHFGNMIEASQYKPDLIVQAVHLKMFSVHVSLVSPFAHDEAIYYYRHEPELLAKYRKLFDVKPERYYQIWSDFQVRKISQLYRQRGLIGYFLTGDYKRPTTAMADWVKSEMGWIDPLLVESARTTHDERNADYLWKVIPQHVVQLNYNHCEAFDMSDENLNWRTFVEYNAYAERRHVKLLEFLNPINKAFVEQKSFFDWDEVMPHYRRQTLRVAQKHGNRLVDATEKIDTRYFSDLDHLNMNGHEQLAEYMLPYIVRELKRK